MDGARWVLGRANRLSDNRLTRPVRRPIETRVQRWLDQVNRVAREGEMEELQGKLLAMGAGGELIQDILDEVAANPEVLAFV